MGVIVVPLALLIAIAWFGAILLPVFAIDRLTRGLMGGRWLAFVLYPAFLYLGWWIPNIPGHQKQQRMDVIAKQCGWTQTKRIDNVPGVYIDGNMGVLSGYGYDSKPNVPTNAAFAERVVDAWGEGDPAIGIHA